MGYVYNKLDFETSKALTILAYCWPLQGDFIIFPRQVFCLFGLFFVWLFSSLVCFDFQTAMGNDLESGIDRNLDEAC